MKQFQKEGVRFALAQMPVVAGSPRQNADWMIVQIAAAAERGIDVIVFPELAVSGYLIGDMFEDDAFVRDVYQQNECIIAATNNLSIVAIFGTLVRDDDGDAYGEDGRLRKINGGLVAQGGILRPNQAGMYFFAKTNLPKYRMFDEVRHMYTAQQLAAERGVPIAEFLAPFDLTIREERLSLAAVVCEDMWDKDYLVKPVRLLAQSVIDLVVNISFSPWGWQKNRARNQVVKDLVREVQVPFIYVNGSWTQNNGKNMHVFDGTSTVYNERGEVVEYIPPYYEGVVDIPIRAGMPSVDYEEPSDIAQLHDGLLYGIRGQLALLPEHLSTIVIGLSGGVDSAVVAALMVEAVGKENVVGINMPYGDYNSAETKAGAAETAKRLGIAYHEMPITDVVDLQAAQVGTKPGSGQFKTLQAIARMNVLSAYASQHGGVFTSNGNKTEIAFGYYTLNGDGRGVIAPIGDLLKGEVYQLAHYLNADVFGEAVIPQAVIDVDPMDELGPQGGVRTDPYDYGRLLSDGTLKRGYHDQMVHAFIGFRKNPEWFLEQYLHDTLEAELQLAEGTLVSLFDSHIDFVEDLERCWRALHAATWKRVQSVPNVLVSKRAFGWDYRESIMAEPYFTNRYFDLKEELLHT